MGTTTIPILSGQLACVHRESQDIPHSRGSFFTLLVCLLHETTSKASKHKAFTCVPTIYLTLYHFTLESALYSFLRRKSHTRALRKQQNTIHTCLTMTRFTVWSHSPQDAEDRTPGTKEARLQKLESKVNCDKVIRSQFLWAAAGILNVKIHGLAMGWTLGGADVWQNMASFLRAGTSKI